MTEGFATGFEVSDAELAFATGLASRSSCAGLAAECNVEGGDPFFALSAILSGFTGFEGLPGDPAFGSRAAFAPERAL